jgi:glycosyltransferase involved in cell wall biosynthesis
MPTHVAELEISRGVPPLDPPAHVGGVLLLVRRQGRPLGLVRLRGAAHVRADHLARAVEEQVDLRDGPPLAEHDGARLSVVVCTRDRPEELRRCLEALRPLHVAGHQVVVVDNAPGDARAERLCAAYPYHYLLEPTPGLNRARNRGLAASRHEVVAFTDDDCEPDPRWPAALAGAYADQRVGAATGLVLPRELETRSQERFEAYCANRRTFRPQVFAAPETPPCAAGVAGMGANMSFRRALLVELGGFDPRFDGGMPTLSGGDTETFARVLARGHHIAYRPDALVWHRHRREPAALRRVVFGYGVGLYAVLAKRWLEDGDRGAWTTGLRWLLGPPVKAAWNAIRRRPATPPDLLLMEALGAVLGPARYRAANRAWAQGTT